MLLNVNICEVAKPPKKVLMISIDTVWVSQRQGRTLLSEKVEELGSGVKESNKDAKNGLIMYESARVGRTTQRTTAALPYRS